MKVGIRSFFIFIGYSINSKTNCFIINTKRKSRLQRWRKQKKNEKDFFSFNIINIYRNN